MKIIAHIGSGTVLVEMHKQEFAHVVGKDYESELECGGPYTRNDGFQVGTEYNASEIYKRLRRQEQVNSQLDQAANSLNALADLIRHVSPTAKLLTESEVVK